MIRCCRLFIIFISALFQKKILLTDISTLSFRVWPPEADKKYMNKDGQLIANSLIKVLFRGKDSSIPVQQIFSVLGQELNLPHKPLLNYSKQIDEALIESHEG